MGKSYGACRAFGAGSNVGIWCALQCSLSGSPRAVELEEPEGPRIQERDGMSEWGEGGTVWESLGGALFSWGGTGVCVGGVVGQGLGWRIRGQGRSEGEGPTPSHLPKVGEPGLNPKVHASSFLCCMLPSRPIPSLSLPVPRYPARSLNRKPSEKGSAGRCLPRGVIFT